MTEDRQLKAKRVFMKLLEFMEGDIRNTSSWNRQKQKIRKVFVESFLRKAPRKEIIHDVLWNKFGNGNAEEFRRVLDTSIGGSTHGDHNHLSRHNLAKIAKPFFVHIHIWTKTGFTIVAKL